MRRRIVIALAALAALAALVAGGVHVATRALRAQVIAALGPDSEVGAVTIGFGQVRIDALRVPAPTGWPARDLLRAERVVVTPDLRSLLSPTARVSRVTIERAYLSVLRDREGRVKVLPGLAAGRDTEKRDTEKRDTEKRDAAQGEGAPRPAAASAEPPRADAPVVRIAKVELRESSLDFYDESVRRPALRIRVDDVALDLEDLVLPALDAPSRLRIAGTVRGAARRDGATRDGTVAVNGWIVFASRDSELAARLRGVDLVALQPYLIRTAETGVRSGVLDLDLDSTIRAGQLDAPGVLTLASLELDGGSGTFMGLPQQAVVALMKGGSDRITVKFALRGSLDDPRFSLNEAFAVRVAAALAKDLGVSLEGVVRGLGSAGGTSAEAAGEAAKALGSAIRGLFGR